MDNRPTGEEVVVCRSGESLQKVSLKSEEGLLIGKKWYVPSSTESSWTPLYAQSHAALIPSDAYLHQKQVCLVFMFL